MILNKISPKNFNCQIEKIYTKYLKRNKKFNDDLLGINAADVFYDQKNISKILNKSLQNGQYTFSAPTEKDIFIGKKKRHVFSYTILDNIVQGVLYEIFSEKTKNIISPQVYSYQKGKCAQQAIHQFLKYIKSVKINHKIDLFVFRGDILKYTDNIPIHNSSFVWQIFNELIIISPEKEKKILIKLITNLLRPELKTKQGYTYQKYIGIPTGNAISTLVANLYLIKLDQYLTEIPGSFYARYGDDFIFAHTNITVFNNMKDELLNILSNLKLSLNNSKNQNFYFNRAGRKLDSHCNGVHFIGTNKIDFLGYQIYADGTYSLSNSFLKSFMRCTKKRIENTSKLLENIEIEKRGQLICDSVNTMFNSENLFYMKDVNKILNKITNRGFLKNIDYEIALAVSEYLSGIKGVYSWRKISYKMLREQWGLKSLCHLKNYPNKI